MSNFTTCLSSLPFSHKIPFPLPYPTPPLLISNLINFLSPLRLYSLDTFTSPPPYPPPLIMRNSVSSLFHYPFLTRHHSIYSPTPPHLSSLVMLFTFSIQYPSLISYLSDTVHPPSPSLPFSLNSPHPNFPFDFCPGRCTQYHC